MRGILLDSSSYLFPLCLRVFGGIQGGFREYSRTDSPGGRARLQLASLARQPADHAYAREALKKAIVDALETVKASYTKGTVLMWQMIAAKK